MHRKVTEEETRRKKMVKCHDENVQTQSPKVVREGMGWFVFLLQKNNIGSLACFTMTHRLSFLNLANCESQSVASHRSGSLKEAGQACLLRGFPFIFPPTVHFKLTLQNIM